jgi:hypothetical protein
MQDALDGPVSWEIKRQLVEIPVANIRVDTTESWGVKQAGIPRGRGRVKAGRCAEPGDASAAPESFTTEYGRLTLIVETLAPNQVSSGSRASAVRVADHPPGHSPRCFPHRRLCQIVNDADHTADESPSSAEQDAREDLVAGLGAAFLCADLRLTPEARDDHASYIASWLTALKNDKRPIFSAAAHAKRLWIFLDGFQQPKTEAA